MSITDTFTQKLDERAAAQPETPALEMTFAGLPCKVRPLPVDFYVRSGRMPDFLTRIAFSLNDAEAIKRELESVSADDVIQGRRFQGVAVCRVLDEPRVVLQEGDALDDDGALDYAELAERAPDFVDGIFSWVLMGCPVPEKGGEGISGETLETFSEKPGRTRRARTRGGRKAVGDTPVNSAEG
jgi:hypothetical protein